MTGPSSPWTKRTPVASSTAQPAIPPPAIPPPAIPPAAVPQPTVAAPQSASAATRSRGPIRLNRGLLIGVAIAFVALLVAVPALTHREPAPASSATPTAAPALEAASRAATVQANRGVAMGTVLTNKKALLEVAGLLGAVTLVHTDADTVVLMPGARSVSDIPVGDFVIVHGDKEPDGSVTANLVVGGSPDITAK